MFINSFVKKKTLNGLKIEIEAQRTSTDISWSNISLFGRKVGW